MKKDALEQLIQDHRDQFDDQIPSSGLWSKIAEQLGEEKEEPKVVHFPIMRMMQIAAMFVVVLGVGLLIGLQLNTAGNSLKSDPTINEFFSAEQYYNQEINKMVNFIGEQQMKEDNISEDLKQLDEVYEELRQQLIESPDVNTEQVVNALLSNYRAKIEILQTVLDKYSNHKENLTIPEDEKIDI